MFVLSSIQALYLFFRIILPLKIARTWKGIGFAVLLLFLMKYKLVSLFMPRGAGYLTPDLPGPVLLLLEIPYITALLLFLFTLSLEIPRDLFLLGCRLFHKKTYADYFRRQEPRIHLTLLILAFLVTCLGIQSGCAMPEVRRIDVPVAGLPDTADGFRIVLLADFHADRMSRPERLRYIVDTVNSLEPDAVAMVGDFADGLPSGIPGERLKVLAEIKSGYGSFGVTGNHEYYSDGAAWLEYLPTLGIRMLNNEHEILPCGIVFAGVTDPAAKRRNLPGPDLSAALSGIPEGVPVILLAHQPKFAKEAAEKGVDLQLSGHTHGGMIPVLKQLVALFNGGFVSGAYQVGNMLLYVSNGTGIWSGFSLRIFTPSEITVIRLTKASDHPAKTQP